MIKKSKGIKEKELNKTVKRKLKGIIRRMKLKEMKCKGKEIKIK